MDRVFFRAVLDEILLLTPDIQFWRWNQNLKNNI
jgi:hypothetical protein